MRAKRLYYRARSQLLAAGVPWEKVKAMSPSETMTALLTLPKPAKPVPPPVQGVRNG